MLTPRIKKRYQQITSGYLRRQIGRSPALIVPKVVQAIIDEYTLPIILQVGALENYSILLTLNELYLCGQMWRDENTQSEEIKYKSANAYPTNLIEVPLPGRIKSYCLTIYGVVFIIENSSNYVYMLELPHPTNKIALRKVALPLGINIDNIFPYFTSGEIFGTIIPYQPILITTVTTALYSASVCVQLFRCNTLRMNRTMATNRDLEKIIYVSNFSCLQDPTEDYHDYLITQSGDLIPVQLYKPQPPLSLYCVHPHKKLLLKKILEVGVRVSPAYMDYLLLDQLGTLYHHHGKIEPDIRVKIVQFYGKDGKTPRMNVEIVKLVDITHYKLSELDVEIALIDKQGHLYYLNSVKMTCHMIDTADLLFADIASSGRHTLLLTRCGHVLGLGRNNYGQWGIRPNRLPDSVYKLNIKSKSLYNGTFFKDKPIYLPEPADNNAHKPSTFKCTVL